MSNCVGPCCKYCVNSEITAIQCAEAVLRPQYQCIYMPVYSTWHCKCGYCPYPYVYVAGYTATHIEV